MSPPKSALKFKPAPKIAEGDSKAMPKINVNFKGVKLTDTNSMKPQIKLKIPDLNSDT